MMEPGLYRQDAPPTSVAAAESVSTDTLRRHVMNAIIHWTARPQLGGATDEQIQEWLGMNPSTQRPRRVELVRMGLVRDSGRKRATSSGRLAIVWEAV